jgi:hypothetical protein
MTTIDREALKAHIREQAFDTGRECDTCKGEGRLYPGRRVVHTRRGGFGADWDEDAVLRAIDEAADRQWGRGLFGPFLALVEPNGAVVTVDVPPMVDPVSAVDPEENSQP